MLPLPVPVLPTLVCSPAGKCLSSSRRRHWVRLDPGQQCVARPGEPRFLSWLLLLHKPPEEDRPPVATAGVQVTRPGKGTWRVFSTGRRGHVQGGESVARYTPRPSHLVNRAKSAAPNSAFMETAHSSRSDFRISGNFFIHFFFMADGGFPLCGAQGFPGTLGASINFEHTTVRLWPSLLTPESLETKARQTGILGRRWRQSQGSPAGWRTACTETDISSL